MPSVKQTMNQEYSAGNAPKAVTEVGVIAIGRNEGDRLRRCLESILTSTDKVVYVDSGSSDGSVELARGLGVQIVELDTTIPFCAARARNAGYKQLLQAYPHLQYIQFIDADCEIIGDWLFVAVKALAKKTELAIVAGWLKERSPEKSIYNRLGDLEWNASGTGEVDSVGGIFMIRHEAFDSVGGFDPTVAAGEEPELCQRLSRINWRFMRLDHVMAQHDLAMMRFGQWWRRMVRNGYGSMDVATRFGVPKFSSVTRRAQIWAAWLALTMAAGIAGVMVHSPSVVLVSALLFSLWPARWLRTTLKTWKKGQPLDISMAYAFFMVIAFMPQISGQLLYAADRLLGRSIRLVEYKAPASSDNS